MAVAICGEERLRQLAKADSTLSDWKTLGVPADIGWPLMMERLTLIVASAVRRDLTETAPTDPEYMAARQRFELVWRKRTTAEGAVAWRALTENLGAFALLADGSITPDAPAAQVSGGKAVRRSKS